MNGCITEQEQRLIDLTNNLRVQHGLNPLIPSAILMESARRWAQYMAEADYFSHDGPISGPYAGTTHASRARALGYTAPVGGNILYGQLDADRAFNAWANSPPHFNNMLSIHYTEIGVALGVEPTYDYPGDVYLAASMELGTGSSEQATSCVDEGRGDPPPPTPKPPQPKPTPPPKNKPKQDKRKQQRKKQRKRERLLDRLRRKLRRK